MKQKAIVTIDTEGHDGVDPIKHLIFGETAEGKYGIEYIMDELDAVGAKALFFVDFAEAWDYGEEKVRSVVETIIKKGHNVGVHLHPDHMKDKSRLFLYEYTKEDQYEMIKKCTDLYEKIVGRRPLSFRAGKYGANLDTLDILCELGYKYDFSSFYHQQWCGIEPAFTVNAPCRYKSIIEFPVTMHTTFHVGPFRREDKIDIEGMTPGELRYSIDQVLAQKSQIIVTLFLHSFSLLKWREQPDMPVKNYRNIKKLKKAMEFIQNKEDIELIGEEDLNEIHPVSQENAVNSQIVWNSGLRGVFYTFEKAIKLFRYNKKAKWLVIGFFSFVLLSVGFAICLILC